VSTDRSVCQPPDVRMQGDFVVTVETLVRWSCRDLIPPEPELKWIHQLDYGEGWKGGGCMQHQVNVRCERRTVIKGFRRKNGSSLVGNQSRIHI
jgi:hypothetical protein